MPLLKTGFHNDRARAFADLWRQLPDSVRAQLQPRPKPAAPPPPPAPDQHSEDQNDDKKEDGSSPMSNSLKIGISMARQLQAEQEPQEDYRRGISLGF